MGYGLLGMEGKLYFKVGGQGAVGSWTELGNCTNVSCSFEKGKADMTTRANNGYRANVGTLKELSIEFDMVFDPDDAGFTAIKDAFFGDTAEEQIVGIQCLSEEDGQGPQADMNVDTFGWTQNLEEGQKVKVALSVAYSDTPPSWVGAS